MKLSDEYKRIAVYHNEVYYLSKYLEGRNFDLSNYIPWFLKWNDAPEILERVGIGEEELEEAQDEGRDEFYGMCDRILAEMSDLEKNDFVNYILRKDPAEAPTWVSMAVLRKRLPRDTWLIHFSAYAGTITEEGFTEGVSGIENLAYTKHLNDNVKRYGGYNFAFVAGDRSSQAEASDGAYGDEAVMFQSSGIEVFHHGDQENQVIYWGKAIDPRTIVLLVREIGNEWSVIPRKKSSMLSRGRNIVYKGTFSDVVEWVKKNWFQYRRQIMGK